MEGVDWLSLFTFSMPPLELIVRGSAVFIFLFLIFRFILHRDVGAVGIADLLVLVIIADAAQNAMGNNYESIADGFLLVSTIVFWNLLFDYLSFRFKLFRRLAEPGPLCLIRRGRKLEKNMRREMVTDEERKALLREHGVASISEVQETCLESDGKLSVICFDERHTTQSPHVTK